MRSVTIVLYRPQPTDHWLNHLVVMFSPPYSHCDILFEDMMASSVYQNETVYFTQRKFSRDSYERISITLSDEEYDKVRRFCEDSFQKKVAFDRVGMLNSFLPVIGPRPHHKTFCSRYVWEALQQTGRKEFIQRESRKMTPSSIYEELKDKGFYTLAEHKMHRIR